jgi:hypothetical protein
MGKYTLCTEEEGAQDHTEVRGSNSYLWANPDNGHLGLFSKIKIRSQGLLVSIPARPGLMQALGKYSSLLKN